MNILNRSFKYTNSASTDIRRLFERVDPAWNKPPRKRKAKPMATVTLIKQRVAK